MVKAKRHISEGLTAVIPQLAEMISPEEMHKRVLARAKR